jgi:hypothetical protein
MIIPKSFVMAGNRWKVRLRAKMSGYGECDFDNHTITIATNIGKRPTTDDERFKTFLHEALHALEYTMGREVDEEFVSAAEQLIYQAIRTSRGNHNEI